MGLIHLNVQKKEEKKGKKEKGIWHTAIYSPKRTSSNKTENSKLLYGSFCLVSVVSEGNHLW